MLRIGICDDEQGARFTLRCSLERCLERQDIACRIFDFSSAEGLLKWQAKHPHELDLLFLDIEMGELDGMAAARQIRQTDERLALVFVTGYADYVFDGYGVAALDYLIKPAKDQQLQQVLAKVQALLYQQEPEFYIVQNVDGLYRIPQDEILYFMSDRRQVMLVTADQEYPFYAKLDAVAAQLPEKFIRTHRRYLVNAQAIRQISGATLHIGDLELPVSRSQRQTVMAAVAASLLREGKSKHV